MSTEHVDVEMLDDSVTSVAPLEAPYQGANTSNETETGTKGNSDARTRSWKSRVNGMVHNQSMRDIQLAIQSTCSFVCAALIAYKSGVKADLTPGWFMTFLSPLLFADTLGGTIMAGRGAVVSYVPGSILVYVLQILGMNYHSYAFSTVVFFILCFWMGYINPAMGPRKIALLLPVILVVTIVTTPDNLIPNDFVWNFLAGGLMAIFIDIAIGLLLLPRYASFEVTDRFYYGLCRNAEVLELIFNAMLSQHRAESEIYLCEADELIRCMQENEDAIGMRAFLGSYEPVAVLRRLFRSHHKVYNRFALSDFPLMNSTMFWHVACLAQAVRDVHFNEYHAVTWRKSRATFQGIATKYHAVIQLLGAPTDMWHVQDPGKIDAAIVELKLACDHMYATLFKSLINSEKEVSAAGNPPGTSFLSDALNKASVPFSKDSSQSFTPPSPNSSLTPTTPPISYDVDARRGANRLSGSFFLFHLSELMQSMDNRFSSPPPPPPAPSLTLLQRAAAWASFLASPFVSMALYVRAVVLSYGVDVRGKAIAGLRTAMLLGIGLIFCEVPKLVTKFENGQWILLAMMLSQSDNLGGTLYQARGRFLGTLVGAAYSYFVYTMVGDNNVYNIVAVYVPAVLVAGIFRQYRQWAYFGSVWVTTGIIITFGRIVAVPRVQDYLLLRIQQNALGIILAFAFTFLTFPVRATGLLQQNVVTVLSKMSVAAGKILNAFNTHVATVSVPVDKHDADVDTTLTRTSSEMLHALDHAELSALASYKHVQSLTYILPEAMVISQRMAQQPLLLKQSVMELIFISRPFPELTYTKLMTCQKKVLHMMTTIDRALLRISQFSELKVAHSSVRFGKRVSGEVRTLLAEVTANLDKWSQQLQNTLDTKGDVPVRDDDLEAGYHIIASANNKHIESRRQHARSLERMHQSAVVLTQTCTSFTEISLDVWAASIIEGFVHSEKKNLNQTEANIHHLFDVLTTFRTLFYASNQLANATVVLGNIMYTILTLENKSNHKSF